MSKPVTIKARRIGCVVEDCINHMDVFMLNYQSFDVMEDLAAMKWEAQRELKYETMKRRGLARCVLVYKEVSHE